jgi:hypothetical protein
MKDAATCRSRGTNLFEVIAEDIPGWLQKIEVDPFVVIGPLVDFIFDEPDEAQDGLAILIENAKIYLGDRVLFSEAEKPTFYAFCDLLFRNLCEPQDIREANAFFTDEEIEDVSLLDQIVSAQKTQAFFRKFQWFRTVFLDRLYESELFRGLNERTNRTVGKFVWDLVNCRGADFHEWVAYLPIFRASVRIFDRRLIVVLLETRDLHGPVLNNYPGLNALLGRLHSHLQDEEKVARFCELMRTADVLWNS